MKQALTEALDYIDTTPDHQYVMAPKDGPVVTAARLVERLLPGECEFVTGERHPNCNYLAHVHCSKCGWLKNPLCCVDGQVWDEGIVEAVAKAIYETQRDDKLAGHSFQGGDWVRTMSQTPRHKETYRRQARAVLSALVELLTEKVGGDE